MVGKALNGESLETFGVTRGRGLGTAVGVAVTWMVPAGFSALTLQVAVPESVPATTRLIFAVYVDGRLMLKSNPLNSADKPAPMRLALGSAKSISLRVEPGAPANATGTGVWLEPTLLKR
jgi:hypothetical protein